MKRQSIYISPVSEIIPLEPVDVVTASGGYSGGGWNNNGNGNGNGHWFDEKPGNGGGNKGNKG